VSEGTNINALCELGKTVVLRLGAECNDMKVGIAQVKYLYQMQDYGDAQEGGPGKGWFRIVKDPTEARQVINDGKLAVVPGLEFSDIFDCTLHTVAGATGEIHGCTREDIHRQIEEVWELGVREVFP
ncbi:UNVERIFIED_CONTAM: peptidase M19, partial [Salmonella enterica subsp. enterica serovar Weltevreden]